MTFVAEAGRMCVISVRGWVVNLFFFKCNSSSQSSLWCIRTIKVDFVMYEERLKEFYFGVRYMRYFMIGKFY